MKTLTRLIAVALVTALLGACATYGTERAGVAGRPVPKEPARGKAHEVAPSGLSFAPAPRPGAWQFESND